MRIDEWDEEASRTLICRLRSAVYPPDVLAKIVWRDIKSASSTRRILIMQDGDVVAAAGLLWRQATLEGAPVLIGGLGGAMTMPTLQGKGLGIKAVEAAMKALVRDCQPAFGLLFCEDKNTGFYSRLGWQRFEGEVRVEQPTGRMAYHIMTAMVAPLAGEAPRQGKIDLCGLPW